MSDDYGLPSFYYDQPFWLRIFRQFVFLQGRSRGKKEMLLDLLTLAGAAPTPDQSQFLEVCSDVQLQQWVDDLFKPPCQAPSPFRSLLGMAATKMGKQASNTKDTGSKDTAAEDAATEDGADLYTLPGLVVRVGKATVEEVQDYVEGYTKAELIKEGAKVGTDRIDTDCARLYGKAADFFEHATPEQRGEVVGVSPSMLRIAVTAAQHGSEIAANLGSAKNDAGAAKLERAARAETARDRALKQRKVLRAGLRSLAAGNKIWHAAIDTAVKTSDAASTLSGSLDALIGVGRRMLKRPTAALEKRLKDSGLTAARLDTAATQADDVRTAGGAADAVASVGPVSQSEVDYWDGINLTLLGSFIDVFEAAHEVDPTIPRLVPIALRNYYRPTRKSPGAPGTPPDATPPPT